MCIRDSPRTQIRAAGKQRPNNSAAYRGFHATQNGCNPATRDISGNPHNPELYFTGLPPAEIQPGIHDSPDAAFQYPAFGNSRGQTARLHPEYNAAVPPDTGRHAFARTGRHTRLYSFRQKQFIRLFQPFPFHGKQLLLSLPVVGKQRLFFSLPFIRRVLFRSFPFRRQQLFRTRSLGRRSRRRQEITHKPEKP
jgi:hypothetical protein